MSFFIFYNGKKIGEINIRRAEKNFFDFFSKVTSPF